MALLPSFLILALFSVAHAHYGLVGVNYGRVANNLPSPKQVVNLLKSQGINRTKIFDTDKNVLTALANSGINVIVCLPNELLSSTASDQSFSDNWVLTNIKEYFPATKIEAIAVGNEVFVDPSNTTPYLVSAMKNIHSSLVKYKLDKSIKVSSPIALSALANSYPPSSGSFKPDLIEPVIKPMLDLLRKTSSYLMVNVYPFFAYAANADKISLDYALFRDNAGNVDPGSGLKYNSLLDAQIDAVYSAMSTVGFNGVKLMVTETGWPSAGDVNEVGASQINAVAYNGGLVKRVLTGKGTPLRPRDPLNVYLFALFNENQKPGPTSERNYGLFYPNEAKVYDVPFVAGKKRKSPVKGNRGQIPPVKGNRVHAPVKGNGGQVPVKRNRGQVPAVADEGEKWCVSNGEVAREKLQAALDYACGEGGADCSPIQPGATCFNPESLEAHASYAFNSYYQKNARRVGTCFFGGAAHVVTQPPRYGKCEFPTKY